MVWNTFSRRLLLPLRSWTSAGPLRTMMVATPNRSEEEPAVLLSYLPAWLSRVFDDFTSWLDRRTAARLPLLLTGILFAAQRRTVTSWFRAAAITTDFRRAYHVVYAVGRAADHLALATLFAVRPCLVRPRR